MTDTVVQFRSVTAEDLFEGVDPDKTILDGSIAPAPAFPVHLFRGCGLWAREVAESKSCPVDYVMGGALAGLAACVGNTRRVSPWAGWEEPSALWVGLMGDPSAGKTPALGPVMEALKGIEANFSDDFERAQIQYQTKLEESRAIKERWEARVEDAIKDAQASVPDMPADALPPDEPIPERLCVTDVSIEALMRCEAASPRGLLVYRDELTGLIGNFGRYGGDDRGYYLEGWNGGRYTVERVKTANKPINIPRHLLSVVGGIQPDKFRELFAKSADDGFPARLAVFWPDPVPFQRPLNPQGLGRFTRAAEGLHSALRFDRDEDGNPCPKVLFLTPEAADHFETWCGEDAKAGEAVTGLLKSHFGKLRGWALRLALVIEHADYAFGDADRLPDEIGRSALLRACAFIEEYQRPMARRVYSNIEAQRELARAKSALKEIQRRREPVINRKAVQRSWGIPGLSSPDVAQSTFTLLEETGWLRLAPKGDTGPGRAPADYHVNPSLFG